MRAFPLVPICVFEKSANLARMIFWPWRWTLYLGETREAVPNNLCRLNSNQKRRPKEAMGAEEALQGAHIHMGPIQYALKAREGAANQLSKCSFRVEAFGE